MQTTHSHDSADFGGTMIRMDAMSQDGFGAIAELAKRALMALEASGQGTVVPSVAEALDAIWCKADQFGNDINVMAEQAGCNRVGRY